MIYWLSHTTMYGNRKNHDSWQIYYEWTFSIVNDHRSPSVFRCFFTDSKGTKMTHSWIGLTISWCLYHSRYEVWHKCDRENRLIWLYFWPPNLSKSWLWSMYVRHLVPGDVSEQLLLSTKWLVGENCVFLLAKSCFSASPLYRRNCLYVLFLSSLYVCLLIYMFWC